MPLTARLLRAPVSNRWFADSSLEESGFEPAVPLRRLRVRGEEGGEDRSRLDSRRTGPLLAGGTNGSNPLPSSGESREVRTDLRRSWGQHDDRYNRVLLT